jgi:uncharacterized protein (DUF1778 family)
LTSSPLRSEKLDFRLTPGAKQTLQRAATTAQRSATDFVLESALASAAETLADRQSFLLDPEQWEVFVAALDAPPQLHPRLARLLQEPSEVELNLIERMNGREGFTSISVGFRPSASDPLHLFVLLKDLQGIVAKQPWVSSPPGEGC